MLIHFNITFHHIYTQIPKSPSHPKRQLPTRRSRRDPLLRRMKLRNGRNGGDPPTTELGELVAVRGIDVDETVHVSDTEALDGIGGLALPLGSETNGFLPSD